MKEKLQHDCALLGQQTPEGVVALEPVLPYLWRRELPDTDHHDVLVKGDSDTRAQMMKKMQEKMKKKHGGHH